MKYREITAGLLRQGKTVALYCDGLFSDTNILYLDKFYNVRPSVVIDNDPRKKGTTLLDVPVMSYAEARAAFPDLYYYIQGTTYQHSLIGSLLEDGVAPDHIVNYVPVEKRDGCLIVESSIGIENNEFKLCYEMGVNFTRNHKRMPLDRLEVDAFEREFTGFRDHQVFFQPEGDCRSNCPMYKPGYYAADPKIRLIGNYNSDAACEMACCYCFFHAHDEIILHGRQIFGFHQWLPVLMRSNVISDALVLHMCPTEKMVDDDMEKSLAVCLEYLDKIEAIHLFSCCYAYREGMEELLAKGMAKVFWSLDAGTEETFEKVKGRKNSFGRVMDNAARYQKCDVFGGASMIPKYDIVKGINDNERDFDGFIDICKRFHSRYCALQWDFADNDNTSEEDYELIRMLYGKIRAAGLKTTYISNSSVLTRALNLRAINEG